MGDAGAGSQATAGLVLLLGKVSIHLSTASEVDGEGIIYEGSLFLQLSACVRFGQVCKPAPIENATHCRGTSVCHVTK